MKDIIKKYRTKPSKEDIGVAKEMLETVRKAENAKKVVEAMTSTREEMDIQLDHLEMVKAEYKAQKNVVIKLHAAITTFEEDGDLDKLQKTLEKLDLA